MDCIAYQALLSMEFSRKEYCNGLSFHLPGDLPNPGIKLVSPELQEDSLPSEPPYKTESLCYSLETNTTFQINYTLIKKEKGH